MLVFAERGKPEYPEKNLSEQRREPTTNSTHIWRRVRESNPGHIGGRRVLSPLRHPCSPKFLDISNYVAPGFSYDQFLRAYECEQTKGFFPYEWVDGLDKLNETLLPPHAAFYSSLKNTNITEQEYEYCQQVWEENNMQTFEDFLVWYNNLEVVPFIEAVEKMSQFWRERKIDMFKDGISPLV